MARATRPFCNRIALVFDLDKTLAPDTVDSLLERLGFAPEDFRKKRLEPLYKEWDDTLALYYRLIEESSTRPEGKRITRELIENVGKDLQVYEGVPDMFDRVRGRAREIVPDIEVEFNLLTCGLVEIARSLSIAHEFKNIWGSEFHFNERGEIVFIKQMITFPEKVDYLLQLSKGLGTEGPNEPADTYRPVPEEELYVPLSQVIYLGDGASDMPVFHLMNEKNGIAIGLYKEGGEADKWPGLEEMRSDRRVENLAPVDFRDGSELLESILLAVSSLCYRIALRRKGIGE